MVPVPLLLSTVRANGSTASHMLKSRLRALVTPEMSEMVRMSSRKLSGRLEATEVHHGDWSARSGYELGIRLSEITVGTAVFVANDYMALGLIAPRPRAADAAGPLDAAWMPRHVDRVSPCAEACP